MRFEQQLKNFCKEKDFAKRLKFYKSIDENEGLSFLHNRELSEAVLKSLSCLLSNLLSDFANSDDETYLIFLNVVHRLHTDVNIPLSVDDDVALEFLKKLFSVMSTTKSPSINQKVVSFLSMQRFPGNVLSQVVEIFLKAIPVSNTASDGAIINVLNRFLEQCPETMESHIECWLKLLLRLTHHSDVYVREQSVSALKDNLEVILSNKKRILAICGGFLKEDVLPKLNALCAEENVLHEILSVQLPIYMAIIGEDYRRSSRLSNSILKFMEKGFCHTEEKIKISAFSAWNCLIDCFASKKDLLASMKYFRLFTQPLKLKLKSETLMRTLVQTMWRLAVHLDDSLPDLFEMLCVPLFGICFRGSARVMQPRRSCGRLSLSSLPVPCENIQILGAEMLWHLLLSPDPQEHVFSLDPLHEPFFASPSVFFRFHDTLIRVISDTISQLHHLFSTAFLWKIWSVSLSCVKTCLNKRRDGVDMFKCLYQSAFRIAEADLNEDLLLLIISSLATFPNKILNSSLHHHSDSTARSMHGTPVDSVMRLLFSTNVSRNNSQKPKFLQCAQSIIACGMERSIGNLEFIQSTVNLLSRTNEVFLNIWTYLCDQVVLYLNETGNVNDGDSLEHDFSSLYDTLLYPFNFVFDADVKLSEKTLNAASRSWSKLFSLFASLTSTISSTQPNEARCFVASRVLDKLQALKSTKLNPPQFLFLEVILFEIVNEADYSFQQVSVPPNRSKKKKASEEDRSEPSLSGFNAVVMKLLSSLEEIFVNSHSSFPPFNILSSVNVIVSNVSPPLVSSFFQQCSCILFEFLRNFSTLPNNVASEFELTWIQILLRLPFSQVLFDSESVSELFSLVLSNDELSLYKNTVDFWEMKVLDLFNPTRVSEDFLLVITEMYKKEGFILTWNDEKKALNLNDSTISDRSNGEVEVCDAVISESDASACEDLPNDVSALDDCQTDVSPRDDVQSVILMDSTDCNQEASRLSCNNEEDDLTQLDDCPYLNSEDNSDSPQNRSLNLRTLACPAVALSKKSSNFKNGELIIDETSSDRSVDESAASPSCVVIMDSDSDETSTSRDPASESNIDASEVLVESSIEQVDSSQESSGVPVISSDDDEPHSTVDDHDDSADVIEMVHVSVNVDFNDVTIESSQGDLKKPSRPKSGLLPIVGSKQDLTKTQSDLPEDSINNDDSEMETVEMVEMSVINNSGTETDFGFNNTDVARNDNSVSGKADDDSVYEYVEMADISVHPLDSSIKQPATVPSVDSNSPSPKKPSEVAVENPQASPLIDDTHLECNSSEYETVEMNEVSMNPLNELSCEFSSVKDETDKSAFSATNRSTEPIPSEESPSRALVEQAVSKSPAVESKETSSAESGEKLLFSLPNNKKATRDSASFNGAFSAACARDLGVKPLDSSFEGCDSVESSPVKNESDPSTVNSPDNDVIKGSLPFVEDQEKSQPSGSKKHRTTRKLKHESSKKKRRRKKKKASSSIPELSDASLSQDTDDGASDSVLTVVVAEQTENDTTANPVADSNERPITSSSTSNVTETNVSETIVGDDCPTTEGDDVAVSVALTVTSPQASDKETVEVETPRSCLGKRTAMLREETNASPSESPCGILKKRVSDYLSPAAKARRVSFAEPISVSSDSPQLSLYPSPFSSPRHLKRQHVSSRLVSRRLSLPAAHRSYEAASPVSVRSASIAAAIADIKAKNSGDNPSSTPSKSFSFDVNSMCVAQLRDLSFLRSLSNHQLEKVVDIVHQAAPLVHSVLVNKLKNQNR